MLLFQFRYQNQFNALNLCCCCCSIFSVLKELEAIRVKLDVSLIYVALIKCIRLSHAMRPGLKSRHFLGDVIIELAKFCFIKTAYEPSLSFTANRSLLLILCHVSVLNIEFSPRKYPLKKSIFSESIFTSTFIFKALSQNAISFATCNAMLKKDGAVSIG